MKPKVAFFDFACCEGCQLQIANLEEEVVGLAELVDVVEFREVLTGAAPNYDIAFIEGSITRKADEERIKDIRSRAKVLIAFGACAATGGVNKLKNLRNLEQVRKDVYGDDWKQPHLDTYPTRAVHEVVKVDFSIPGCPINRNEFLRVVKTVALGMTPELPNYPVCVECKLRENVCLFDLGKTCIGPIARAGCEAVCPSSGVGCEGCRGMVTNPSQNAMAEVLAKHNLTVEDILRTMTLFANSPEAKQ